VVDGEDGTNDADNDGLDNCLDYDSDNDGIYDGTELGKTAPVCDNPTSINDTYPINGTDITKGYFVVDKNPLITTLHTNNDTDSDGLLDGIEDKNRDGRIDDDETNPKDKDTDNDGLVDGWIDQKVWNSTQNQFVTCTEGSTNIFDPWEGEDANRDGWVTRNDDFTNNETNPLLFDSDGDELGDGDEIKPYDIKEDNITNPKNYDSNPLKRDTDGDDLSDNLEVLGWNVFVYWEATNEVIEGHDTIYSDPGQSDTDNDGLNDFDEFAQVSNPQISDTDRDGWDDYNEVKYDSSPIAKDGSPPTLINVDLKIAPIIKKFLNIKKIQIGWNITITVDSKDSSGPDEFEIYMENDIFIMNLQEGDALQKEVTVTESFEIMFSNPNQYEIGAIFKTIISDRLGNKEMNIIMGEYLPDYNTEIPKNIKSNQNLSKFIIDIDSDWFSFSIPLNPVDFPEVIMGEFHEDFINSIQEQIRMVGDPSVDVTSFIKRWQFLSNLTEINLDDRLGYLLLNGSQIDWCIFGGVIKKVIERISDGTEKMGKAFVKGDMGGAIIESIATISDTGEIIESEGGKKLIEFSETSQKIVHNIYKKIDEASKAVIRQWVNLHNNFVTRINQFINDVIEEIKNLLKSDSQVEWALIIHKSSITLKNKKDKMKQCLNHTINLGCEFIKIDIDWKEFEPENDNDNSSFDQDNSITKMKYEGWNTNYIRWFINLTEFLNKTNKRIILSLVKPPDWYYSLPSLETQLAEWSEFCEKIAKIFGDKVDYYLLFNEENHPAHTRITGFKLNEILENITQIINRKIIIDADIIINNIKIPAILLAPLFFERGSITLKEHDDLANIIVNVFTDSYVGIGWQKIVEYWCMMAKDHIDILGIDHYPGTWNIPFPIDWKPVLDILSMINDPGNPCYGKIAALMETGYSTMKYENIIRNNMNPLYFSDESQQEDFINYRLEAFRTLLNINNYFNSYQMKIACWYTLLDGNYSKIENYLIPREHFFGILKHDWVENDWIKKMGYDDLKIKISEF
jgi:hypothetical protein